MSGSSPTPRDSFARYRDRLSALGFRPSRRLGQNFLLDPTLHAVIADAAALEPGDHAVEVGVGLGFLTRALAERADRVLGVEFDPILARVAGEELADLENLVLVEGDAVDGPLGVHPAIAEVASGGAGWRLVANLPYKVSGPLLGGVMGLVTLPRRVAALVQAEFAERVAASAGGRDYGSLSCLLQGAYAARIERYVGSQVFRPRPNVRSAILVLEPRRGPLWEWSPECRRAYGGFLRGLYQHRRKRLGGTWLRAIPSGGGPCPEALADRRPEAVGADEMAESFAAACAGLGIFG